MNTFSVLMLVAGLSTSTLALAQTTEDDLARKWAQKASFAILQGETLLLLESRCPNLPRGHDYRQIVQADREFLEKVIPAVKEFFDKAPPLAVADFLKSDGGCEDNRLLARHRKTLDSFLMAVLESMQTPSPARK